MTQLLPAAGTAAIFVALFLGLAAGGLLSNDAPGVSRSLAVLKAFSAAPPELRAELEPSFRDRVVYPLLDRTARLGYKLTPADYSERIRRKLELAGNPTGWTVDRVISMKFVGFMAALGLGLTATSLLHLPLGSSLVACVIAALVGYLGPNMFLYQLGYDRTNKSRRGLPDALDLLTISVESGLGFDAALSQVAKNTDGPLAEEFARVLQEMQIGLGRGPALRGLADRSTVPEVRGFVSAMVQADALGIPIAHVLRVQSREIRTKRRQRAEEQAQKLAVKILIPLIFCILPCLFIAVLGPAAISIFDSFAGKL